MNCNAAHPLRPDLSCDKEAPCTGYHANAGHRLVWPHDNGMPPLHSDPPPPKTARTRKSQLAEIARRIR